MKHVLFTLVFTATAATAGAQSVVVLDGDTIRTSGSYGLFSAKADVLELQPLVPKAGVRNAPFTADAVTEFVQVLGDGNRIERSFTASIARDSQGRTRREQQIAMVGPLATLESPDMKYVVISDPVTGVEFTLDEDRQIARRSSVMQLKLYELERGEKGKWVTLDYVRADGSRVAVADDQARAATQSLGTRTIEGLQAEGTRTTMTIAAGTVGNVQPIDVITERWYSKDLQMDVLISRRDPRNGNTTYRLSNLVRAEPPPDLFAVPQRFRRVGPRGTVLLLDGKAAEPQKRERR